MVAITKGGRHCLFPVIYDCLIIIAGFPPCSTKITEDLLLEYSPTWQAWIGLYGRGV